MDARRDGYSEAQSICLHQRTIKQEVTEHKAVTKHALSSEGKFKFGEARRKIPKCCALT